VPGWATRAPLVGGIWLVSMGPGRREGYTVAEVGGAHRDIRPPRQSAHSPSWLLSLAGSWRHVSEASAVGHPSSPRDRLWAVPGPCKGAQGRPTATSGDRRPAAVTGETQVRAPRPGGFPPSDGGTARWGVSYRI
jgi:hypothetical protein